MGENVAETLFGHFDYEPARRSFLHPGQTAAIFCEGEEIGYLGKVAYEVAEQLDLRYSAYLLELDLKKLSQVYEGRAVFVPLPKYPEESRDLALVMEKDVTCGQVEKIIRKSCGYIGDVKLFDVYVGDQIPENKKSMAFTVRFVPGEEPFEADSVDRFVKKILKNLKNELNIELRS